jgi:hypothetical protein
MCTYRCMYTQYIQGLGQSSHLNGRMLNRRQVQASYISCVGVRLVQSCERLHFHDFV